MGYIVIDRNGEPLHEEPFDTEREAYEAKRVYEDHCYEPKPYKVVRDVDHGEIERPARVGMGYDSWKSREAK
jgi:hypothetical protein